MGTKVQSKSYWPGYYSMRDTNEDSSTCGWPVFYGDKSLTNGQYYNGYLSRAISDACSGYDKDVLKRTMLEHEAIFKNQVYELHRLYRIQRDLMDEIKRKELHRNQISTVTSCSHPVASQILSEDAQKWHIPKRPIGHPVCARPPVSGVEGIQSPLSSNKGSCKQAELFLSQNGCTTRDVEVPELRPTKVRKKLFDLELPADEYIDTKESEKLSDKKMPGISASYLDRNCVIGNESFTKIFPGDGRKCIRRDDNSRSEQCSRNKIGLADLNEPVQVEEVHSSAYVDLLGHDSCKGVTESPNLSAKLKSLPFGLNNEVLLNSNHGSDNRAWDNNYVENRSERRWISHVLKAGQNKRNLKSVSQGLQPEKTPLSPQAMRDALNKFYEPSHFYLMNQNKVNSWEEKTVCDLESSDRSHQASNNNRPESVISSYGHGPSPFLPSCNLAKSWSESVSSWEIPSQKSIKGQMQPHLKVPTMLSKNSKSGESNGIFGNWPLNGYSKSSSTVGCEDPPRNGFCQGSSSGSKEMPVNLSLLNHDYLRYDDNLKEVSEHLNNYDAKCFKGSHFNDNKPSKDVQLNVVLPNSSSNRVVVQTGIGTTDRELKHEDHAILLPSFGPKAASHGDAPNAGKALNSGGFSFLQASPISNKDEIGKVSDGTCVQNIMSVSSSNDIEVRRSEAAEHLSSKKLLGFPILDKPRISKTESSSLTSPSVALPIRCEGEIAENSPKNRIPDINLPCDPADSELVKQAVLHVLVDEKGSNGQDENSRCHIDLNLSVSDDEASLALSTPRINTKVTIEIDLEAPAVPEMEEDLILGEKLSPSLPLSPQGLQQKAEKPEEELMINAAEAIVAISSSAFCNENLDSADDDSSETTITDPLTWFVDIISSCVYLKSKSASASTKKEGEYNEGCCSEEDIDYFESMTLKLAETKEEDYMPGPLVPESLKLEEIGPTSLPTRARRGPARRGRQRKDFQRDILPGLVSLSRHEVTEDIQTFDGLMRATGHTWNSALMRRNSTRNGCGRGRRRLVASPPPHLVASSTACTSLIQQLNNVEALENRSLAGWGKTTRRPRRQRCPGGNPSSLPLTST